MKITFLGAGSAFTTSEYYQSNLLVTAGDSGRMLVDCGSDMRYMLREAGIGDGELKQKINAVYVSHLHADHVGGLEWLGLVSLFQHGDRIALYAEAGTMHRLWEHTLKGGMEFVEGRRLELADYFDCHPLTADSSFTWHGIDMRLVKTPHVGGGDACHYSYGMVFGEPRGKRAYFSSDVQFLPDRLKELAADVDVIFHDCEVSPFRTGVHPHYEELRTLPADIRSKMWLYHYQPNPEYDATADGFAGFVHKGQEFQL